MKGTKHSPNTGFASARSETLAVLCARTQNAPAQGQRLSRQVPGPEREAEKVDEAVVWVLQAPALTGLTWPVTEARAARAG